MGAQAGTPPTGQVVNKFEIALGQALLQAKLLTPAQLSQAMWEKTENNLYLTEICLENGWIPEAELYSHVPTDQLRLEELLMLYGYITAEQLQDVVQSRKNSPDHSLPSLVIEQGWIDDEILTWAQAEHSKLLELAQPDAWQTIQDRLAQVHSEDEGSDPEPDPFGFNLVSLDESEQEDQEPFILPFSELEHPPERPSQPAVKSVPSMDPSITQELDQLREQISTLQHQLQTQSQQHEQVVAELTQQVQQEQERIAHFEQVLGTVGAERAQFQQALEATEAEREQLRQTLQSLQTERDQHRQTLQKVETERDHLQDQLTQQADQFQDQIQELQDRFDQAQSEAQTALQNIRAQKSQVEEQLQSTRQAAKKLHSQIQHKTQEQTRAHQAQVQHLQDQLQQARSQQEQLEKQLQDQLQQAHSQQEQLQSQIKQISSLHSQIEPLTQQLSQAHSEIEHYREQQAQDQQQIKALQLQLESQRELHNQVQAKSQKTLELFEEQIRSLTQQLQSTQEAYQASGALLKQQQTRSERLSEEKDQAIEQQMEAQRRANEAEQTCQAQRHQLLTQAEQLTLLRNQNQTQAEQITSLQNQNQAQLEQVAQLEDQVQMQSQSPAQQSETDPAQDEEIEGLRSQLQQVQGQCETQVEQIESLQRQLEEAQQKRKGRPLKQPQPVEGRPITEQIAEAWGLDLPSLPADPSPILPERELDLSMLSPNGTEFESVSPITQNSSDLSEQSLSEKPDLTDLADEIESLASEVASIESPESLDASQQVANFIEDPELDVLAEGLGTPDSNSSKQKESSVEDPELDALADELSDLQTSLQLDELASVPTPSAHKYRRTTIDPFEELSEDWDEKREKRQEQELDESPALATSTPWVRRVMTALRDAALISNEDVDMILKEWEQEGGTFTHVLSQCTGLKPETVKFFSEGGYSVRLMRSQQVGDYLKASGLVSESEIQSASAQVSPQRPLTRVLVDQGILHPKTAEYFVKTFGAANRSRPTVEERFN